MRCYGLAVKRKDAGRDGWRGRRGFAGVVVALTLVSFAAPTSANALINDGWHCSDSTITWHFSDSPITWPASKKTLVSDAINTIDDALDYDGSKIVTLSKTTSSGIPVQLNDSDLEVRYGEANCVWPFGIYMWLSRHATADKFYYKVARHEMMNLVGAQHAGRADSLASGENPTTMSTCINWSAFLGENELDRDAEVQLNWHHSSLPGKQVSANIGFENGVTSWGGTNGSLTSGATGGEVGPKHAVFSANGTSADSFVRQTVRLWTGDDGGVELRAYINARSPGSSVDTKVKASLWRKYMSQGSDGPCLNSNFNRGLTDGINSPTFSSTYLKVAESALTAVSTSWTHVYTPWTSVAKRAGHELQVRAYGNSAGDHTVRFDNVRAEER